MQTDAHPIAHFFTKVESINGNPEPLEIEIIIRQRMTSEPIIDKEVEALDSAAGRKGSPYIHPFTTNLSDANKLGLDNLAYWGIGPRRSKTYLMNQALAQYLSQYKASQQPIPTEEA